jgi:uncharacterized protein YoxC
MWKQIADLMAQVFTFARDIQQNKADIREVREELKATQQEFRQLALVVERLMYEVRRSTDRAESDREKMALQVENTLLKFERRLPPTNPASGE